MHIQSYFLSNEELDDANWNLVLYWNGDAQNWFYNSNSTLFIVHNYIQIVRTDINSVVSINM